jgi:hypothetical protein
MLWAPQLYPDLRRRSYPGSAGDDRAGRLLDHAELVARRHPELPSTIGEENRAAGLVENLASDRGRGLGRQPSWRPGSPALFLGM